MATHVLAGCRFFVLLSEMLDNLNILKCFTKKKKKKLFSISIDLSVSLTVCVMRELNMIRVNFKQLFHQRHFLLRDLSVINSTA